MSTWQRCSIRARLTVITSAVMALICTVIVILTLIAVRQHDREYRAKNLVAQAVDITQQAREKGTVPPLPDTPGTAIQVFDPSDTLVAATPNVAHAPPMARLISRATAYATKDICDLRAFPGQCKIGVYFPFHMPDGLWRLHMVVPDVPWYVSLKLFGALIAGWILLVGVTGLAAYRIVGRTLAPVDVMTSKLAEIAVGDLSRRVPVPWFHDELRRLAERANQTLDRAETAVERQRRFASDASHDLRSPLTAMHTEIEEALLHPDDTDWEITARALLDSVERQQALVSSLLQIARLDAGAPARRDLVDLAELVTSELALRPRGVTVTEQLAPDVTVTGDRLHLARLLGNLLDNAERHAESNVTIRVARDGGTAVLEVQDDGDGIPLDKRDLVFQRFARLDASRRKDAGGTGLGLPIARQIAENHGGTLTIGDSPRGARFVLRIPLCR
ncbi:HAMP domain-containing histidine kinase [Microtetraspora sp. AC03309]|uniref:sensor histidine kinase n=1 Tax=Microtetraspora sp. AC03309 TaxID=2779376 RepID=UPI001E601A65|nr:HAMP domain-containing sensor histidine kinase [Microtetraspora sp. AC03309]MCC5581212.1 HAMP domain-containing histidine kinase [Microtetraspora sp. AC03309]